MDTMIKKIDLLLNQLPSNSALRSQLNNHREMYVRSKDYLSNKNYQIAFIGNVGAGKTTSICHLLGLVYNDTPILSTGCSSACEVSKPS